MSDARAQPLRSLPPSGSVRPSHAFVKRVRALLRWETEARGYGNSTSWLEGCTAWAPYGIAGMIPGLILGGNIGAAGIIAVSDHTLFMGGLILFVLWLLYKILSSLLYAVVGLVVLGVVLLQFHLVPPELLPFNLPRYFF